MKESPYLAETSASEGWRQSAELFADERVGRHLFQTAWTWGAAHIIDQCSRGKLVIL
jgi:hypothetical protein